MPATNGAAVPSAGAGEDPTKVGQWLDPFPIDNVAVHASLLPTGKILCWGRRSNPMSTVPGTMDEQKTMAFLLNTKDQTCVYTKNRPTLLDSTGNQFDVNLFCSGYCFQPNGNLLVVGGHLKDGFGAQQAFVYNPFKDEWKAIAAPNTGRWYPSAITLPDSKVLTISGCHDGFVVNNIPQIWQEDPVSGKGGWVTVSSPPDPSALYPRMFLTPDGKIFVAGPQAKSQVLDLGPSVASAPPASGTGAKAPAIIGTWNSDGPLKALERNAGERQYGSAALYDCGKVIWTGGGNSIVRDQNGKIMTQDDPTQFTGPPTGQTEIIDLNEKAPQWRNIIATTLPDGTVLATGGTQGGGFNSLDDGMPVHTAELWDPATGAWTEMAKENSDRCYHGNALLLPTGEVLSAGSGEGGGPARPNPTKYNLTNAQVYRPPYLFKGKQPIITGLPQDWTVKYGQPFSVTVEKGQSIVRVSWIRIGSVTHGMNMNQAVWNQKFNSPQTDVFSAKVPDNRNLAPPGHYMVFFLNTLGVPSVAPIAKILPDTTPEERTPNTPVTADPVRAAPRALMNRQVAISNLDRNKQIISEQKRPAVVVGLNPACPYGLGPCWGGAAEGLNAIKDVDVVRPVPDQANSLAFVYLKEDILPDIDVWRNEFADKANGSYGMRGIEMTLSGVVTKKGVGAEEHLTLAGVSTRPEVTLAPYQASSQIEWDMTAQAPRPVTEQEAGAYALLSSVIADHPAGVKVQVTGRLQKHDTNAFSLDVRAFQQKEGVNGT
ncbi:hypothetical protein LTR53_005432 [Teratosphaeriaceae sp. CCFEE 6253]|nr:hypothetical protein LTR53_005432 [Teratosphaeriaceae sp. CCFEE 6253]